MKLLLVSLLYIFLSASSAHAQKKVRLYIKLVAVVDGRNNIGVYNTYPPYDKKIKALSIDSLINYNEINEIIKNQNNQGVRILSELDLIGWKLDATIPIPLKQFADPTIIFLLSKEYEVKTPDSLKNK